ncbi:hypothetical protein Aph02nite_11870 [Actinoplanes philippinensis]|uniref:Uncharacterized protein n=1 Tax=Actinoplanes philippinensis TaxID=35752 RepID=A0A1I1ZXA3_9ACTN|nr:hypothetical protein [Actinoplanes philippinensis]GIE75237.1 hypothetical protein Aph02nite_11870 [Actinoplanes philippinensis]SFE36219.1 hypothetical protein SAMN05421541_101349 [Actinoplanes philippinensis]
MRSLIADGKARLLSWRRVREFAVPASMIETATVRRSAGDWAGACAAAHVDVDLDLRVVASGYGREFAALVRADLRRLAPDLLRWHLPRTVSDGLLRPGLTMSLARYAWGEHHVHLVARTAPSWADAGQRVSLALWDPVVPDAGPHPRPRPDQRFRLDLHPHLWAADRAFELRERCGLPALGGEPAAVAVTSASPALAGEPEVDGSSVFSAADGVLGAFSAAAGDPDAFPAATGNPGTFPATAGDPDAFSAATAAPARDGRARRAGWIGDVPDGRGFAVHRWTAEAAILRAADGYAGPVAVRLGNGRRLLLSASGGTVVRRGNREPVLPYAAMWMSPDLELLQAGMITAELLHPLVAEALTSGGGRGPAPAADTPEPSASPGRLVECCGETHRLGLVDGRLTPLDHGDDELRREELLATLGGPPLPCLRAVTEATRHPECLDEVRTRLDHGDHAGAAALVAGLLGPGVEPGGALREAFTDAEEALIEHRLYRAGLSAHVPAGVTAPIGPRKDRAGRRGRHHRLPKRAA